MSRSVQYANGSENVLNTSSRRSRSVHDAELGHFMLLFCRGRHEGIQRFLTHVLSYCFAH